MSVVGEPDPDWGETVVAFVVAVGGAAVEPAALDALCLDLSPVSSGRSATCSSMPAEEQLRQGAEDGTAGALEREKES